MKNKFIKWLGGYTTEEVVRKVNIAVMHEMEDLLTQAKILFGCDANKWAHAMYNHIKENKDIHEALLSEKKVVFVSLPISGYEISERKKYAKETADMLKHASGVVKVVTPFDVMDWHDGEEWDWYMVRTLALMQECTTVYFCDGWDKSPGCRMERKEAIRRNMEIWI